MQRFLVVVCVLGGFILLAIAVPQIGKTEGATAFLLGLGGLGLVGAGILIEVIGTLMKK